VSSIFYICSAPLLFALERFGVRRRIRFEAGRTREARTMSDGSVASGSSWSSNTKPLATFAIPAGAFALLGAWCLGGFAVAFVP
jgi:hypothetical protein